MQAETAMLGVGSLLVLFLLRRFAPSMPGPLVILAVTLIVVGGFGLADQGVAVVGEPSGGLFGFGLPNGLAGSQVVGLLPGAFAIVVLGFTESMGAATSAAQKTGERVGNLFAALLALLATLVLRPLFEHLAQTVLAALIIFAMAGMVNVEYFRRLWLIHRREFGVAMVAPFGVLTFGVLPGVVIGVVMALVLFAEHISRPPTMVLGRTRDGT